MYLCLVTVFYAEESSQYTDSLQLKEKSSLCAGVRLEPRLEPQDDASVCGCLQSPKEGDGQRAAARIFKYKGWRGNAGGGGGGTFLFLLSVD